MCSFSPDRVRVRGARGAGAGGHRDGEAGRVPHLRGLLGPEQHRSVTPAQ